MREYCMTVISVLTWVLGTNFVLFLTWGRAQLTSLRWPWAMRKVLGRDGGNPRSEYIVLPFRNFAFNYTKV